MERLVDRAAVRRLLETDRVWCGYALADLDPEHWPHTEWWAEDAALLLLYHAVSPPFLFTHGPDAGRLLDAAAAHAKLLISVPADVCRALEARGYRMQHVKQMMRMGLAPRAFAPHTGAARKLTTDDLRAVESLHSDGDAGGERPDFFLPSMLASGAYAGIFDGGELVASAGTHIVSDRESVAAVGNVYVKRSHRGQGMAKAVTAEVVAGLLDRGIATIVLSVEETNAAAICAYQQLGFQPHTPFVQAVAAVQASARRGLALL
jgi:ribosomal protein S18 acetylase RimI-like enzyme